MTVYSYVLVRVPERDNPLPTAHTNAGNLRKAIMRWAKAADLKVGHGVIRHDRRYYPVSRDQYPAVHLVPYDEAEALWRRLVPPKVEP